MRKEIIQAIIAFYKKTLHNWIGACILTSFILNIFVETLARKDAIGAFIFFKDSPIVFLFNTAIIFSSLTLSLLVKRRLFCGFLITMIWVGLGVANSILVTQRMTPLTIYDFSSTKDAMAISLRYLTTGQVIATILAVVFIIVIILIMWFKAPRRQEAVAYKTVALFICGVILLIGISGSILLNMGKLDYKMPNLATSYKKSGFTYCFFTTWAGTGIDVPKNYNERMVREITNRYLAEKMPKKRPNIVFVQLESLIDPQTMTNVKLDRDAIPNLRRLYKECSSGKITVPVTGGGTANTEFESITGMSLGAFGPGEFPYRTVLQSKAVESIPYNLKRYGYGTHAIHNHTARFYGRKSVYPKLGFDTFTSFEYMNNIEMTPKEWAKDFCLTKHITDAMESTKGPDYVYTVSVQGHGEYPTHRVIQSPKVRVLKAESEKSRWQWEYYANQINEMDLFVKQFLDKMKNYKEDVIVVMYGDHLPAMYDLSEKALVGGRNIYQTDYFIWANFPFKKQDKNITTYQIGAELLKRLNMRLGTILRFQQENMDSKDYIQNMNVLIYDMIYGKHYSQGGKNPAKPTDMRMGIIPIKVSAVKRKDGAYYVEGDNFTPYSRIKSGKKEFNTIYINPRLLRVGEDEKIDNKEISNIKVEQEEIDWSISNIIE